AGARNPKRVHAVFKGERKTKVNKRSVWTITTQPYPEAHFATFPEELPQICILAGTSAKGCCAKCRAPWERIVERESYGKEGWGPAKKDHTGNIMGSQSMIRDGNGAAGFVKSTTLGWQPICECESEVIPCTVLDPFAGSGTTGKVALELGRSAILIELNPK